MSIRDIDAMPVLAKKLRKDKRDRIRYALRGGSNRSVRGRNTLQNTVREAIMEIDPDQMYGPVDDILTGVANLEQPGYSKPLSVRRLLAILQSMPVISSHEIAVMLNVGERQAQRYMVALRVALPFLERHFASTKETQDAR